MTATEIQARITALETRIASFAGIRNNTFGDQSMTFDLDDAYKELARLRGLLGVTQSGSVTRYAVTSKGA